MENPKGKYSSQKIFNDSLLDKKSVQIEEKCLLDDDLDIKEPRRFSILRSFAALGMIERKTVSFHANKSSEDPELFLESPTRAISDSIIDFLFVDSSKEDKKTRLSENIEIILDETSPSKWKVLGEIALLLVLILTSQIITYASYPGLVFQMSLTFVTSPSWFGVVLNAFFFTFDTIGKLSTQSLAVFSKKFSTVFTILRIIYIVLFILLVKGFFTGTIFNSDAFKIILLFMFSFTSGYTLCLILMYAPKLVKEHEREMASFWITFGVMFGAFLGTCGANFAIRSFVI